MLSSVNRKNMSLSRKVLITQAGLYPSTILGLSLIYIFTFLNLTGNQLRFMVFTLGWETVVTTILLTFLALKWVRPIDEASKRSRNGHHYAKGDLQGNIKKFPIKITTLSVFATCILFLSIIAQVVIFMQHDIIRIFQLLILAIINTLGVAVFSILVYDHMFAHSLAFAQANGGDTGIMLSLKTKMLIVMTFFMLLSGAFFGSASYKNTQTKLEHMLAQQLLNQLHMAQSKILHPSFHDSTLPPAETDQTKSMRWYRDCALFYIDAVDRTVRPLILSANTGAARKILDKNWKQLETQTDGSYFDAVSKHFIVYTQSDTPSQKLVMLKPDIRRSFLQSFFPKSTMVTIFVLTGVAILLCLLITKNIRQPLDSLVRVANQVANGTLVNDLNYSSNDELGSLGMSMTKVVRTFTETIMKLNDLSKELTLVTKEIVQAAAQDEELASRQSSEFESAIDTLEKLSESGTRANEESHHVLESVEDATYTILILSDKIKDIGRMSATINEISEQINMLSLNASIEAARAGEQGKGFAVIANEIRELADNTNRFTINISKLIEDVQNSVQNTILSTEKMVSGVRQISRTVEQQSTATKDVTDSIEQINNAFRMTSKSCQGIGSTIMNLENLTFEITHFLRKYNLNEEKESHSVQV